MERRIKVFPPRETKDMALEEVALFAHSPVFRKADGEVIKTSYFTDDVGWKYVYRGCVTFSYNPSKLTREELHKLLT